MKLETVLEVDLDSPLGQCRAVPVELGPDAPRAVLAVHCADFDVDPWIEMFFFPTDTLKLTLFTATGEVLWRRDLGKAVVPGMWFCPVFPFDLDGDGRDEIFFVGNTDPDHPLGMSNYVLERIDARTGGSTGRWRWPYSAGDQPSSYTFRNFILGGYARGEPVLVTAQGTYARMSLQGWRPDMTLRWERVIGKDDPGARGSHMCPVIDMDGDGVDEVLWGERAIELDAGCELFCADRESYRGHSDVVQPFLDRGSGRWYIYTCREGDPQASPRVVVFDAAGRRAWGDIDEGHIDMGFVAHLDGAGPAAGAIRIGKKTCGPAGRFHFQREEFAWNALTGTPRALPFSTYRVVPVDLDGDGFHELVRGIPGGQEGGGGEVLDGEGRCPARIEGTAALASKFLDLPGEQLLTYHPEGLLRAWADREAQDSPAALARYRHPFYRAGQRLAASGSNLCVLGGL